ncbi:PEP-CTERM sorting domain-containing protein [Rubrivivax albus]|uniref:PEP-CTERM sorting domain-containing protein n=1 Tax=Rubrivivax albus TaxID=2499835 RepID=A0A437JWJ1_9BURK|nr:PEP-CTERM sorting domain-containing protein [Rubrivivax albus]RVT51717.1 PEP-CTERM sorting domain-containing protein [Rubrivivax albus]
MRLLSRVAAISAALLVVPAWADSSTTASASLTGLGFTLVDLAPADGVAPTITFSMYAGSNAGNASTSYTTATRSGSASESFSSPGSPWAANEAAAQVSYGNAASSIGGSPLAGTFALSASGSAMAPPDQAGDFWWTLPSTTFSAGARVYDYGVSFSLSANTLVLFTAQASVDVAAVGGGSFTDPYGWLYLNGINGYASASLTAEGPAAGGGYGYQTSFDQRDVNAGSYYDYWLEGWVSQQASDAGPLAVSFVNATGDWMDGQFRANVYVSGSAYGDLVNMPAVPEPGTAALWLAGLAFTAFTARRRSR